MKKTTNVISRIQDRFLSDVGVDSVHTQLAKPLREAMDAEKPLASETLVAIYENAAEAQLSSDTNQGESTK